MSQDILEIMDEDLDEFEDDEGFEAAIEAVSVELAQDEDEDGVMSEARAREITEAIRSSATVTFILIARAHKQQAHKALGYKTWADYVSEEFDMSAQRSYQLLDLSKVTQEIEAAAPSGTEVKLTEAQARDIKRELPMVTEKIREETEGQTPEEAAGAVDRIVDEIREQKREDEKALAQKSEASAAAQQAAQQANLETAADQLLEKHPGADPQDELIDVTVAGDNEVSPEDSMNLYNFFNALAGITMLPEPDAFVKVIPKSRRDETDGQLLEAAAWLNRFQTLWELEHDEE